MTAAKIRVGVLVSGRGSNLQALIDACRDPAYPARIVRVISNVPDVMGLDRATQAGIATATLNHKDFPDRESFENAVHAQFTDDGVDLVCLAGFMRLLTDGFVGRWHDRLINIHPSLLPAFKGIHIHERVLEAGVRFTGCTVHFVRPAMDAGPVIVQAAVPVHAGDTPDTLGGRVLQAEHRIYPLAVKLYGENRLSVTDERVDINGPAAPDHSLINPTD